MLLTHLAYNSIVDTNANLILDLLEFKSPSQSKSKKPLKVIPSLSFEQGCYFVSEWTWTNECELWTHEHELWIDEWELWTCECEKWMGEHELNEMFFKYFVHDKRYIL